MEDTFRALYITDVQVQTLPFETHEPSLATETDLDGPVTNRHAGAEHMQFEQLRTQPGAPWWVN